MNFCKTKLDCPRYGQVNALVSSSSVGLCVSGECVMVVTGCEWLRTVSPCLVRLVVLHPFTLILAKQGVTSAAQRWSIFLFVSSKENQKSVYQVFQKIARNENLVEVGVGVGVGG